MDAPNDYVRIARAVRAAALSVEGVRAMGRGTYAEAATYGAGEKVTGVVADPDEVRVHVVVGYPPPGTIPEMAGRVLERVAPHAEGRKASVIVEDVEVARGASPRAVSEEVDREGF